MGTPMRRIFLGVGSNLGDREQNLARAVTLLARLDGVKLTRTSSLYDSAPVGPVQERFLNAVVELETTLGAVELLRACKGIEALLGRREGPRWGPREIDLDLLLGEEIVAEPNLQVPHLELHKRAFALAPLCELEPEAFHPVLHERLSAVLARLPDQDVRRLGPFYVEA